MLKVIKSWSLRATLPECPTAHAKANEKWRRHRHCVSRDACEISVPLGPWEHVARLSPCSLSAVFPHPSHSRTNLRWTGQGCVTVTESITCLLETICNRSSRIISILSLTTSWIGPCPLTVRAHLSLPVLIWSHTLGQILPLVSKQSNTRGSW